MAVKEHLKSTGWDSIDTLLLETTQVLDSYQSVKEKVDYAHSSFKPQKPSLFKIKGPRLLRVSK